VKETVIQTKIVKAISSVLREMEWTMFLAAKVQGVVAKIIV
jgi:hypothetical protein